MDKLLGYFVEMKMVGGHGGTLTRGPLLGAQRVDLWLGAHTHTAPDGTYGSKSHIERRWGTTFINVAGLTKYMGAAENCVPRSWLLTFTDGTDELTAQCYLHTSDYAPQG